MRYGCSSMDSDGQRTDTESPVAESPLVSVVIVCMNNMVNLRRCLPGLKAHTSVPFEALVVAYRFSPENLAAARAEFPWATFVESNEIRGFSENNNLALRKARGKYCFVLNDDTELRMPAIDRLVADFDRLPPDAAIVSPKILWPDGRTQVCGVPYKDWRHVALQAFRLWDPSRGPGTNGTGVFRSYNVCGAAFAIRTDVFRGLGWFDERFFFCPEDIALSTSVNRAGYSVWVDADALVLHDGGMSGKSLSRTLAATRPAAAAGALLFYGDTRWRRLLLRGIYAVTFGLRWFFHSAKGLLRPRPNTDSILADGDWRTVLACFSRKSPKEIFLLNHHALGRKEACHGR